MSDQQQHPMDSPLRAWAAARRQGVQQPFELHPVDRAQLQEEVAHTFPPSAAAPASSPAPSWRQLWPRLVFIGGMSAVLLFTVVQLARRHQPPALKLAQADQPAAETLGTGRLEKQALPSAETAAAAPALSAAEAAPPERELLRPQAVPTVANQSATSKSDSRGMLDRYGLAQAAPAPAPPVSGRTVSARTPASIETPLPPAESAVQAETAVAKDSSTTQPPPVSIATMTAQLQPTPAVVQSFTPRQQVRRNFNAPAPYALQSGFRLEQRGQQVKILDQDGSVYEGELASGKDADTRARAIAIAGIPFEVSGTNLSQQVLVVFRGTLSTGAPVRIQGSALLDNRDRVVVDAVQAGP